MGESATVLCNDMHLATSYKKLFAEISHELDQSLSVIFRALLNNIFDG